MFAIRQFFLAIVLAVASVAAFAHGTGPAVAASSSASKPVKSTDARDLTIALLDLVSRYNSASPGEKGQLLAQLIDVAHKRQDELAATVDFDPEEVLRVAIPDSVRANLPPQAIPMLEQSADESGTLEVYHVDHVNPSEDYYVHYLANAKGRFSLHFAGAAPDYVTGTKVRVRGVRLDSAIVLAAGSDVTLTATLAAALPNTLGVQKTLTILVNFSDAVTQPYTVAQAQSIMFTTTSNYDYETSYQQTSLSGDVAGWFTIASTSTTCDSGTIASQAQKAASSAGFVLSNYNRYVYVFPSNTCTWWGLGSVGGNPSQAWIHTKWGFSLPVVGHEMGHNFGLYHSHSLDCGTVSLDANSANCTASEYGDIYDMMGGGSNPPHFNAFQKERLGWLNAGISPPLITVNPQAGTTTYTISPLEDARNTAPRALKIARGGSCGGTQDWFYVEARQAKGFDSFLSGNTNIQTGVMIHKVTNGDANSSYLLDMTPATATWADPALVGGSTFTDPLTGVTIMPVSVGGSGATINVTFGATACTPAAPSITVNPTGTVWTAAGSTVSYAVSVKNMDSCGCAATTYGVGAGVPAGWNASSARTASVSPGSTTTSSVAITTAAGATAAFYPVTLNAVNDSAPSKAIAASGTVAIASAPGVSVTTSAATYTRPVKRNQTVYASITTTVTSSGSAVSGAAVNVRVTNPAGSVTTYSATTGNSGTAVVSYPIKFLNAAGSYAVNSTATIAGMSQTATTAFTVK
jgi:hypothetical protein